jgi:predicted RNase H-like HicB family nuclease
MGAYEVIVEQKRGIWLICVPEIPEVRTQARRLTDVAENAREAIAVWLNAPYEDIDVSASIVVSPRVPAALE